MWLFAGKTGLLGIWNFLGIMETQCKKGRLSYPIQSQEPQGLKAISWGMQFLPSACEEFFLQLSCTHRSFEKECTIPLGSPWRRKTSRIEGQTCQSYSHWCPKTFRRNDCRDGCFRHWGGSNHFSVAKHGSSTSSWKFQNNGHFQGRKFCAQLPRKFQTCPHRPLELEMEPHQAKVHDIWTRTSCRCSNHLHPESHFAEYLHCLVLWPWSIEKFPWQWTPCES